jgi:hypothetical protein
MHIADWLQKLGMSEYAERFADNRIDISVLPDLTDQDLEKMGVVLGDRRKILRAILRIASEAPAIPQATAVDERPRQDTAERRQLTVMFADLVGSTVINSARRRGFARNHRGLSPLLQRIGRAQWRLRREVHRRRCARLFWLSCAAEAHSIVTRRKLCRKAA